uniref:DNA (cytosine-5-)-methyltransferase n=2 Tax=Halorubrum lacusprofundi TaxID=2247 RepID=A0A220SWX9_9EURY|nr:DNA cytosine methyltransferase [Halorubrum lacusprofundi]ASK38198.1 Modification methylase HhaI [Halorubrum lacusprofundi]
MFAGIGGATIGLAAGGFDVRAAWETDPVASYAYRVNHTEGTDIAQFGDATDVRPDRVPNDLDLLFSGPPCQGFSSSGGSIEDDPRNQLAFCVPEWADAVAPKVVVVENVVGLQDLHGPTRDILARRKRRGFPSTAGNPVVRFGFKTGSPGVDGAGFDPRPGASCGAVTGAPIRKRVIAVDFQPTALTQSVEPRGSVSARFTPCRPKAINRASRAPQTWVECGPHPALVRNGMWRNPIETHVCGRLSGFGGGSGRATGGGCVTERTRFTPAVNGGILSLIKDSRE